MSLLQTAALLGTLAASVSAHGRVQGIVAGGKWYQGYDPSFQYQDPPPTVIGWSIPQDQDLGFVAPDAYSNPDIICHKGATPAGTSAKVAAGGTVELQWTDWPESHHGPVLDYLAKCSGSCSNAEKSSLKFFKIDEGGLIDGASSPGKWASDQLIANNQSWTVTIPKSIAPGNYVLRHEIIALHSAGDANGAQNYPQCINLQITGSGSDSPAGIPATQFYKPTDPGILVNIYTTMKKYIIPGPPVYGGGSGSSPQPSSVPVSSAAGSSSAAAASSSAPASSSASSWSIPVYGHTPSSVAIPSSTSFAGPVSGSSSYAAWSSSSIAGPASGSSSYGAWSSSSSYPVYSSSSIAGPASGSSSYGAWSSSSSYPVYSSSSIAGPASSSSSYGAWSSSTAGPVSGSSTTCTKTTITITKSVGPSGSSAGPVSGSSSSAWGWSSSSAGPLSSASAFSSSYASPASSSAAPPPNYSALISSIYEILPSGALTETYPAMPTGTAGPAPGYEYSHPEEGMPPGITLGDLLDWLSFTLKKVFSSGSHARDVRRR